MPKTMLSLSQSVGYAIRALSCMEDSACAKSVLVKDIAACAEVPPAYLTKIFAKLVQGGILISKRGPGGGTSLARPARKISLLEISTIIDGPDWNTSCLLGMDECSDARSCPTHAMWKKMRQQINKTLAKTSLAEVLAFETMQKRRKQGNCGTDTKPIPGKTHTPAKKGARRKTKN